MANEHNYAITLKFAMLNESQGHLGAFACSLSIETFEITVHL